MINYIEQMANTPRALAQELRGGVPAGGGVVPSSSGFSPGNSVMPMQADLGSAVSGVMRPVMQKMAAQRAQDRYDYGKVNVDWNRQSDMNRDLMNSMYSQELANPTGIIKGSSAPTMLGQPSEKAGGAMGWLKGLFGGQ